LARRNLSQSSALPTTITRHLRWCLPIW
jgi:hypothetical protein